MMSVPKILFLGLVAATLGLAGCATPSSVKETAAHTIALTSELDKQLTNFRKQETLSEQFLLQSILVNRVENAQYRQLQAPDMLAAQAANRIDTLEISSKLKGFVAGLDAVDQQFTITLQQIGQDSGKLLAPLPSTTVFITATQKELAPLTKELSLDMRLAEIRAAINVVRKSIEENKVLIRNAEADQKP